MTVPAGDSSAITPLDLAELDTIRDLRLALHEHHAALPAPPGFTVRDPDDAWAAWRDTASGALAAGTAVVLVHRDERAIPDGVAYVRVLGADGQRRPVIDPTGDHGELVTLSVAPSARGLGIGAMLTAAATAWCRERGLVAMHVVVRSDNDGALRFYERLGARPTWETLLVPLDQDRV